MTAASPLMRVDPAPERLAPARGWRPGLRVGALSAVLHGAALLVLCRLVLAPLPDPRGSASSFAMLFAPSPPASLAPPSPPEPATLPPAAAAQPAAPTSRAAEILRAPAPARRVTRHVPVLAAQTPATAPLVRQQPIAAHPPATQTASPPPNAPDPEAGAIAQLTGQVQRAVQQAAAYPPVARRMALQGRVQIRFDYAGGAVSDIAVAHQSDAPILDRAAMQAVRDASYPPAPAPIGRRRLAMLVWVDFRLQPEG